MKKFVSFFLAVMILFSSTTLTSFAVSVPTITAVADVSAPDVGDIVKITVSTSKKSKLCAITAYLQYDASFFEVKSVKSANVFSLDEFGHNTGRVAYFGVTSSYAISDNATTLFTIEFRVLRPCGTMTFEIKDAFVSDGKEDVNITSQIAPVTITFAPPCEHINNETTITDATCTQDGKKVVKCLDCGRENTQIIYAQGHLYHSVITNPTCTEKGYTIYFCDCGDTYTGNYVNALGHVYNSVITPPTCTEGGYTTCTCDCGDTFITNETPAKGHTYNSVVTQPTCTESGHTTYTCACGNTYTTDETSAIGHSDTNSDGKCDSCNEVLCDHNCHKGGISGFFWKISNFFNRIFGSNKYCECGIAHY